ncbi:ATP-grasp domain-containing protein [Lysinibacillus irui]|uniref:ATP-grasp domain-containing protein n=1 Tax=Lysinibacillus irui TaxID=2998077 RepID=A0AAJ5RLW5_9BACI|nr:ATP-grasp domain-containing protein [Lysinibacillus irui]WDV07470.1 ATP-grasp domain-containing protein [Lysinibacillus irui]
MTNNILLTSVGGKVPLIQCLKEKTSAKIIGCDIQDSILSKNFLDDFFIEEKLENVNMNQFILTCKNKKINYIIPTREADLLFFSEWKNILEKENIFVMVSDRQSIEFVNDKYKFYQALIKEDLNVIPVIQKSDLKENKQYVLKECKGAGSKNLLVKLNKNQVLENYDFFEEPIIQPYIKGKEFSIDIYITKNKKVKATIVRERVLVIDGESQITQVVEHPKLSKLIEKAALVLNLEGHVMFQAFEDNNGELWIIECNARIGGASTLSIYAGLDTFNWWIAECNGQNIDNWPVETKMLKQIRYKKDLIL